MNQRLDELMRAADPVGFADQPAVTGGSDDPLYLTILEKRGDGMTLDEQTKQATPPVDRRRRGILVAAAAFVAVLVIGVAFALFSGGTEPEPAVPSTTTTSTTQAVVDNSQLDAGAAGAIAVATDAGYVASVQPWQSQLTFLAPGPEPCQLESDAVQFTELDTLTSYQTMVAMNLDDSVGMVEILRFADPAVAEEAAPILERLLRSRRECMANGLQRALGNSFDVDEFTSIEIEEALGGYLFSSRHADGSERVARIQVLGAIEGDVMYVITFRSNAAPVDNSFIEDLFNAARGA